MAFPVTAGTVHGLCRVLCWCGAYRVVAYIVMAYTVMLLVLQDYIDSMEGATLSGRQCANVILAAAPALQKAAQQQMAVPA